MELNRIYNEDNLATCGRMPDGFIDLVVTSPPYDNLRTYNGFSWDFEALARELYRVVKKGGVVVWVVGDATINGSETGTSFRQALYFKEIGFNLHDTMIYRKENPIPLTHNRYEQEWEYMFVLAKGKPSTWNPIRKRNKSAFQKVSWATRAVEVGAARRSRDEITVANETGYIGNIWGYVIGADRIGDHSAPFPCSMVKDHILSWSNENDIIYDPFMGSGTTAKAAHQLKRNWIGSEISSEYVELANKRLEPYLAQESLF